MRWTAQVQAIHQKGQAGSPYDVFVVMVDSVEGPRRLLFLCVPPGALHTHYVKKEVISNALWGTGGNLCVL